MSDESTPKEKKTIPSWYRPINLCEASVDLTDFGAEWGEFALRDPTAFMQNRWYDKYKGSASTLEPETLGLYLQANYGGADEPCGKWPGKKTNTAEWVATAKALPTKIALRIMSGGDFLSENNGDSAGN